MEPHGIDPLAPLEHLAQGLIGFSVHAVLGIALGLLGARLMRHRHLHWSWAAVAFVPVVLVRAPLAGSVVTLGMSTIIAAVRGRRWHREDLEAGADLAEIARERRHPLDALRIASGIVSANLCAIWASCRAARWGPAAGVQLSDGPDGRPARSERGRRWLRGDELTLGADSHGRPVSIRLGSVGEGAHTMVAGATGSGKTVTMTWIATQAIARDMALVVVDPKDDHALREAVRCAAQRAGRRCIEWTPTGPSVYNPYARGGTTEIADKVLAGERYTEPHYQRQAQRYLGHAVRALRGVDVEVSLASIVRMLDPIQLELLARELPPGLARAVHDYLDSLTPRQCSDLAGVRDRLAIMAESDVGAWLDPVTPGAECFDLLDALRARAVVHFSLQADSRPLLAHMLGGAIVQDLQTVVSALQGHPVPSLVLIDEFSAVSAGHVGRLFGRARSAGVSLLLGTQELSDLRLPGHETLLEQVLGNLSTLIAHRQVVPDSAELVARLAGTTGVWHTTRSSDGKISRVRAREYLISPDEICGLPRGRAAVIRLTERGRVAIAQVLPPAEQR